MVFKEGLGIRAFEGCLVGVAVGDALGQPIEFLPEEPRIHKYQNASEIRRFRELIQSEHQGVVRKMIKSPLRVFKLGEYTDDTDQTLALVDSLVGHGLDPEDFSHRLIDWYDQLGAKGCGKTTKQVILLLKRGKSWQEAGQIAYENNSPPANGSLMRTAPIGLYFLRDPDRIDGAAAIISRITHPHPEAVGCCQIQSRLVSLLVAGETKEAAFDYASRRYGRFFDQVQGVDTTKHQGGAMVTLKIALNCFMETTNFEDAVVRAINRPGDTDSYGAVAGALAGAHYGIDQIPLDWRNALNPLTGSEIAQKARPLCRVS